MEEEKKYLMRIVTGEIIEYTSIDRENEDIGFAVLLGARFSHDVTFGQKPWVPSTKMHIAKAHIVYILEKESN